MSFDGIGAALRLIRGQMQAWEIISIGDIEYLWMIYTAAASLGESTLMTIGSIGFLICLLAVGFKAVISGGKELPLQNLFLAFIVWLAFFGSTTTGWGTVHVALVDKYTGETRVVANVPRGVAIPQSILSRVGLGLTELMETAFSTPDMARHEFGSALHAIIALRELGGASVALSVAMQDPLLARNVRNLEQYIVDCFALDAAQDPRLGTVVMTSRDALAAMETQNQARQARYELPAPDSGGASSQTMTCPEMMSRLRTDLSSSALVPAVNRAMSSNGREDFVAYLESAYERLGQSSGSVSVHDQIRNIVVASAWQGGMRRAASQTQDAQVAAMMEVAAMQRATQWAGEQDLFMRYVRPLCTFIEGLLVALTPLVALLLAAGLGGMSLFFKYMMIAIWIQLWFPLMAIINLYSTVTTGRRLDAIREMAGREPESIVGSMELITHSMDWLGTAGMLAASVPALSLMLIYGSAVTATHLAGRLQGQDFINEKTVAPDMIAPAPVMQQAATMQTSAFGGTSLTGAPQETGTYSVGTGNSVRQSETESEAAKTAVNFSSTLSSIATRSAQFGSRWTDAVERSFSASASQDEGRRVDSAHSEAVGKSVANTVRTAMGAEGSRQYSFGVNANTAQIASGVNKVSGALGQVAGIRRGGGSAADQARQIAGVAGQYQQGITDILPNVGMSYQDANRYLQSMGADEAEALSRSISHTASSTGTFGAYYREGLQRAASSSEVQEASQTLGYSDQQALQQSSSEMAEASRVWAESRESSMQSAVQLQGSFANLAQFAARQGDGYVDGLVERVRDHGMGDLYEAGLTRAGHMGYGGDQARALSALWALSGQGQFPHDVRHAAQSGAAREAFGAAVRDLHGTQLVDGPGARPSDGVAAPAFGEVSSQVNGALASAVVPTRGQVAGGVEGVQVAAADPGQGSERLDAADTAAVQQAHGEGLLAAYDRKDLAFEGVGGAGGALATQQYFALADAAARTPFMGPGELMAQSIYPGAGPAGAWSGYSYDAHRDFATTHIGDPVLGAGLAAGYWARSDSSQGYAEQMQTAMDRLRTEEGLSSEDLARAAPMVAMGLRGHVNLIESKPLQGVVRAVRDVDAAKSAVER